MKMPDEELMEAIAQRDLLYTFMARVAVYGDKSNSMLKELMQEDMNSWKEPGADVDVDHPFIREVIKYIDASHEYYYSDHTRSKT